MTSKKQILWIVIFSALLALILNVFVGRLVAAKISTWPLLNKWKILSPEAPIVITNKETVRVSDGSDILQAANTVKSKISAIAEVSGGSVFQVGSAVNLTSDGTFVTGQASFADKNGVYFVVLNDGRQAKITQRTADPATSLVFFKAQIDNAPAASLGASGDLSVGDKILFAQSFFSRYAVKAFPAYVNVSQSAEAGQIFESDNPRRGFGVLPGHPVISGEALANSAGEIVGIWNGSSIISSDVLQQAVSIYFANQQNISRPSFGFSYSIVTAAESGLSDQAEGARVSDFSPASPAKAAGLLAGDIITSVDGQSVSESSPLEEVLQKYKPGDSVVFSVSRKNQTVSLTMTAGDLK